MTTESLHHQRVQVSLEEVEGDADDKEPGVGEVERRQPHRVRVECLNNVQERHRSQQCPREDRP